MSQGGYGRVRKQQDPGVEKSIREIEDFLQRRKLRSSQLDLRDVGQAIGRLLKPGQITALQRFVEGLDAAKKIVVDDPSQDNQPGLVSGQGASISAFTDTGISGREYCLLLNQKSGGGTGGVALRILHNGTNDVILEVATGAKLSAAGQWTDAGGDSPTSNKTLIDDLESRVSALEGP